MFWMGAIVPKGNSCKCLWTSINPGWKPGIASRRREYWPITILLYLSKSHGNIKALMGPVKNIRKAVQLKITFEEVGRPCSSNEITRAIKKDPNGTGSEIKLRQLLGKINQEYILFKIRRSQRYVSKYRINLLCDCGLILRHAIAVMQWLVGLNISCCSSGLTQHL